MQEIALGEMGMTSDDFWNSTPREFHYRQKGYYKKIERQDRNDWERTRWQTTFLLNIHVGKGKNLKPTDLAVFPWEKAEHEKKNYIDPERLKRIADAMDRDARNPNSNKTPVDVMAVINQ